MNLFGLYEGMVVDVADPLGLHRVRVSIPGVTSKTGWARPKTAGGGGAQRGGHVVPAEGHTVFVQFLHGDPDRPVYEGGAWGKPVAGSELPTDVVAAGGAAEQVSSLELSRAGISIRFTVDERDGQRTFRIVAVQTRDGGETIIGSIELDLEKRVLDLYALAGVRIRSMGFVDIAPLITRIQGRRVRRTAAQI